MAEQNAQQTGITLDQVNAAIATALKPITDALKPLADQQKILADTIAHDVKVKADEAAAKAEAAKKDGPGKAADAKPLTLEDVARHTQEAITKALAAQKEQAQSSAARESYMAEKLKGLPPVYQKLLGNDPAKWAAEEQTIRDQFKADAAAAGLTVKDVAGGNPGGAASGGAAAPSNEAITRLKATGLSDGEAAFAASLKMPA